jgi:hypothetical protein
LISQGLVGERLIDLQLFLPNLSGMARTHIVSPLDLTYLRNVAAYLAKLSAGYEAAAKSLEDSELERVYPEKFASLIEGLDRVTGHFDQICNGVQRAELAALWEKIKDEPFPSERYDKVQRLGDAIAIEMAGPEPENHGTSGKRKKAPRK